MVLRFYRLTILILGLSCSLSVSAQNYSLQFPVTSFVPQANIEDVLNHKEALRTPQSEFDGVLYKLIQFETIPTEIEKQALRDQGVELLQYVRNYAWLTSLPIDFTPAQLRQFPIRLITDFPVDYKLSKALHFKDYPAHALTDPDHIRLDLHLLCSISMSTLEPMIGDLGGELLYQNLASKQVEILLPIEKIPEVASFPFVYHVREATPSPELEQEVNRTSHRSNYVAADHFGGLHFTGEGVTSAVSEGMVDTSQIDFHGRIYGGYHTGTSFSGHATGVCRRMAGAGNLNPLNRGMAYGADLITINGSVWNNTTLYFSDSLRIANHSYGYGCSYGYNSASITIDNQVRTFPSMMHVFSCGNIGTDSACNYYGAPGWANITGAVKQSKNVIATGSVNAYDQRLNFSSKGPAYDGRIKPDMCAVGPGGTSHAAPGVAGVMTQLYQAFKFHNSGLEPDAGLIKGILQNTGEDLGNPGPDFQYGYGRINARRAYNIIANGHYLTDSIANGITNAHTITVPSGTSELRCMVYWTDYEASAGASAALVNDLDAQITDPSTMVFQPWVLDTTANGFNLDLPAVRGRDSLNNMEQITISNPVAGAYILNVEGSLVPMGPQKYYVIYEFVGNELVLTHPIGGEGWVPGENEIIRWDSYGGGGTFDLEFSADSGGTWSQIATNIPSAQRYYDYTVPDTISGYCLVRISRGSLLDESDASFSIIGVPENLDILWSCGDSAMFTWDPVPGATGYEVNRLGARYMDFAGTSTQTLMVLTGLSTSNPEWLSVKALGPMDAQGRRAIAFQKMPGDTNCVPYEGELMTAISPVQGFYPDCITANPLPVSIRIRNNGINVFSGVPVAWQVGTGTIHSATIATTINPATSYDYTFADSIDLSSIGIYDIKIWIAVPGDTSLQNDTLSYSIEVYPSGTVTPAYTQDFDSFATCNTGWGCADISCTLSQNWFNIPNNPAVNGDSIDFRTDANGTGTGNTGPPSDHTSGNGNYLYLETSGNGGSGCQNKQAELHSPCFDLRGTNQPELSFWYHMYGGSIGSLHVDAFVEGQWDMDIMPEIVGDQGNVWLEARVDLSSYAGKIIFVRFRATTGSGYTGDLAIDDVNLNTLPNLSFSADQQNICAGDTVQFTDLSTYINSYEWLISPAGFNFTGGTNPASQNPQVIFNNDGSYTISLIGTNGFGEDTLTETAYIHVGPPASITAVPDTTLCPIISFSGQSGQGVPSFWQWDFGDGSPVAMGQNPIHDYSIAGNGTYNVTLIAGNSCGNDTALLPVEINCLVGKPEMEENSIRLYPNPSQDQLWVDFGNLPSGSVEITIIDVSGRRILDRFWEQTRVAKRVSLDVSNLAAGVYMMEIRRIDLVQRLKFSVE